MVLSKNKDLIYSEQVPNINKNIQQLNKNDNKPTLKKGRYKYFL